MTTRVALIGANGFGLHHRRVMAPLIEAGRIELAGLCDLQPVRDEPDAPVPPRARVVSDYRELLADTKPDIAIVATPPHTHFEIATAAVRAGADVLIEKPPFLSLAEHDAFVELLRETGRAAQVGFQALGSATLTEVTRVVHDGGLGRVTGIGAFGAWRRPDSYYQRAPWAGRRTVAGRPVLDGALVNPFAHAVMQSLAVAEASGPVLLENVELERFCARPLEVDDTAAVRLRMSTGLLVVVAVTLCGDEVAEPEILVHGERGTARLCYTTDELQLPDDLASREVPGRRGLLENLLAHRETGAALIAPVERTEPFTRFVDANQAAGAPMPIPRERVAVTGTGADRVVTIPGATDVLRDAARQLALPSELDAEWLE